VLFERVLPSSLIEEDEMDRSKTRSARSSLFGSVALLAVLSITVGVAEADQAQQRNGGAIQKGRPSQSQAQGSVADSGQISAITGGAVAGIVIAAYQADCSNGDAKACRSIEEGLVPGGAWAFVDGGITAVDDWESPVARQGAASAPADHSSNRTARVHRVLAACDRGDVSACRAFASSVQRSTSVGRPGQ